MPQRRLRRRFGVLQQSQLPTTAPVIDFFVISTFLSPILKLQWIISRLYISFTSPTCLSNHLILFNSYSFQRCIVRILMILYSPQIITLHLEPHDDDESFLMIEMINSKY